MEIITSRQNPLCTHLRKLAASASYRRQRGEFLCDSPKLLKEALLWGAEVRTVVATAGVDLPELPLGVRQVEVPADVMKSVSPMETPQGTLFTCAIHTEPLPEMLAGRRYVVLDTLQDPGNVGTILRTADAFHADGMFLVNGCADLYNPKTLRATMGACFRLPVWEGKLEDLLPRLARAGLPLYATALGEDTQDIRTLPLGRAAVVIGSEGRGVSPAVLAASEKTLQIPMTERCESLNAAAAGTVVLWQMGFGPVG